ncbi:MAG: hypothetical protein IKJ62_01310 [Alphaproteobacteria bacterium]|nr:hypothetical protein [Alphaproteobacteria bacterium]
MQKIKKTKLKHILYVALVVLMAGWVVFRFAAVASENARYVFNAARVAADSGAPIQTLDVATKSGTLYLPLSVQNNRAYVSGDVAANLKAGQRIGDGQIVSVSRKLDLDTGRFVVRTSGVSDGLQFAQFTTTGHFIPLYAINNGTVMVAQDGVAVSRDITVARQDAENAYVSSGLNDGDVVILSSVSAGTKVRVVE